MKASSVAATGGAAEEFPGAMGTPTVTALVLAGPAAIATALSWRTG